MKLLFANEHAERRQSFRTNYLKARFAIGDGVWPRLIRESRLVARFLAIERPTHMHEARTPGIASIFVANAVSVYVAQFNQIVSKGAFRTRDCCSVDCFTIRLRA